MRRMSFALTTDAVLNRTKTVTRRLGWSFLKPGDRLLAVDKIRTRNAKKLAVIEVVSVRREPLNWITDAELEREGFSTSHYFGAYGPEFPNGGYGARGFVNMFCHGMKCAETDEVTRIEFRYINDAEVASA